MRKYKAAAVQLDTQNDKGKNLEAVCGFIREAAENGAVLVSFPEDMNLVGRNVGAGGNEEDIPGYTTEILMEQARKYGIYIHSGSFRERIPEAVRCGPEASAAMAADRAKSETAGVPAGDPSAAAVPAGNPSSIFSAPGRRRAYNTSILLGPDGGILAKYRKIHTFDVTLPDGTVCNESERVCPGKEIVVVDTELGRLGFAICYDLRFPELFRAMALAGAQVIFLPADFTRPTGKDHWEPLLRARAIENGCYVIAAGQTGKKPRYEANGNSMIVDPWGTVRARAQEETGVIYGEIDLDYLEEVRRKIPSLANRREEVYGSPGAGR